MVVSFNPSFKASAPVNNESATNKANKAASVTATKPDSVDIKSAKPHKKGLINGFKNAYTSVKKFFINTGYFVSGAAKGTVYGTFGSAVVLAGAAVKHLIKPIPAKETEQAVKLGRKYLTTGNKIFAAAVGVGILALNMVSAKLNANEKNANVDHRWRTGHNA